VGRPVIGIVASSGDQHGQPAHVALTQYAEAVARAADAVPLLIPSLGDGMDVRDLLAPLDGLLVPGDRSNIAPPRYGGPPPPADEVLDEARDETALALIPAALAAGLPLLAICRGFEELNVALGGTLHFRVHEVAGLADHRAPTELPPARRFAPAHAVALEPGGLLAGLAGAPEAMVNSLHAQGVERLAAGLAIEARAPDGLIEAARVADARGFALGVQWHPEWRVTETPFYRAIFRAFADAVAGRA